MTRDLRTLIYLLNLELREECSRTLGWSPTGAANAIGEQQSKRTQSGSSSRSGRDREQQLKRTQVASMQQQLKRAQSGSSSRSGCNRAREQQQDNTGTKCSALTKGVQIRALSRGVDVLDA